VLLLNPWTDLVLDNGFDILYEAPELLARTAFAPRLALQSQQQMLGV
jgi:hypothetical protein